MDEITRTWMFYSWAQDEKEEGIRLKNQGCLIGSFWNPAAAKELMESDKRKTFKTTDSEFDNAINYVRGYKKPEKPKAKRRKKRNRITIKE